MMTINLLMTSSIAMHILMTSLMTINLLMTSSMAMHLLMTSPMAIHILMTSLMARSPDFLGTLRDLREQIARSRSSHQFSSWSSLLANFTLGVGG